MSFKLFIISVAKLRNKIENAETKREKCWSKREKMLVLSPVPGWSEGGDTLKQLKLYNS